MAVRIDRNGRCSLDPELEDRVDTQLVELTGTSLEAVFSATSIAMAVTDASGVVMAVNPATSQMFGYEQIELVGAKIDTLFVDELDGIRSLILDVGADAASSEVVHRRIELKGLHRKGYLFAVDITVTVVRETQDEFVLFVLREDSAALTGNVVEAAYRVASQDITSFQRDLLIEMARGHGSSGIAAALNERTGCGVAVFDQVGQVLASSGYRTGVPVPADPVVSGRRHAVHGIRERHGDHWIVAACPDEKLLGTISIFDPAGALTEGDLLALEQAASILAAERLQSHCQPDDGSISSAEFAREVVDGCDPVLLRSHARELGYDMERIHWAAAIESVTPGALSPELVAQVATDNGARSPLITLDADRTIYLAGDTVAWDQFAAALDSESGVPTRIGVGEGRKLDTIAHSITEAVFALELGENLLCERPVTHFGDLGVWKILVDATEPDKLHEFVNEWIGSLIEYDETHGAQLVKTLTVYLDNACAAESASAALYVHRNTLRYRLAKITQIIGLDLGDADHRFHLELACRAWTVITWLHAV